MSAPRPGVPTICFNSSVLSRCSARLAILQEAAQRADEQVEHQAVELTIKTKRRLCRRGRASSPGDSLVASTGSAGGEGGGGRQPTVAHERQPREYLNSTSM